MSVLPVLAAVLSDPNKALWNPTSVQDLHREYNNIFKFGNRNAASHLWSTFLFEREASMSAETLEMMFSGFCAVSGSPTRPSDYTRYRLTLPRVAGGVVSGYMYYCCWPCVCDTQDFIRVDTRNVTLKGGETRQYHWAVVGNPCENAAALHVPFVQPFYGRGETRLAREVRCDASGRLIGATLSDHGYPIIGMYFDAEVHGDGWSGVGADGSRAAALVPSGGGGAPQPGRLTHSPSGVAFQDEYEFGPQCTQRAENGYNSGMGEIFRKVAEISPVRLLGGAVEEDGGKGGAALPAASPASPEGLTSVEVAATHPVSPDISPP